MADSVSGMTGKVSARHVFLDFFPLFIEDFPTGRAVLLSRRRLHARAPDRPIATTATAWNRTHPGNPTIGDHPGMGWKISGKMRRANGLARVQSQMKGEHFAPGSRGICRTGDRSGEGRFPATCLASCSEALENPPL